MSVWYLEEIEGVTLSPSNPDVGLDDIHFFAPTEKQAMHGVVAVLIVKTTACSVRVRVLESVVQPGLLYLRPPQSRQQTEDGEIIYHDEVKFSMQTKAQILRYIHMECKGEK